MDNHVSINPVAWAGIDLAKATFQLAFWGQDELRAMRVESFERTRQGCKKALAKLQRETPEGCRIALVMEATGSFAETTAAWFLALDPSILVAIANPIQTSAFIRSLGLRNKTDDLDAKALAKYGEQRNPFAWAPLEPDYQVLRDMVRARQDLVRSRTAMNLRLKDHDRCAPLATKALRAVIRTLERQIEALDAGILKHVEGHTGLKAYVERMESIKGVGRLTAATVLAELGDLKRFTRSRQLTAFAGLSPRQKQSGTSVHGRSPMCKRGSGRVRSALFMAAVAAVRFNPDMAEVYDRLLAQGKHKRVALGAVMRKLLVIMRALVVKGRNWQPKAVSA
jgi:transposase